MSCARLTEAVVTEDISCEVTDGVAVVTIARPQRLNALDSAAIETLTRLFHDVNDDDGVRVLVLTGTGDRAFSSGADLKEMSRSGHVDDPGRKARGAALFSALLGLDKPTIAAVNGLAVGVGYELVLACDLRIAVPEATFALPEARLGLGSMLGSVVLPRLLPAAIAARMLFTGEAMTAHESMRWGIVNDIVPHDDLMERAVDLARTCAASAPLSLARYKQVWRQSCGKPLAEAILLDGDPDPYTSGDRLEGVRAHVERRAPRWAGR
jgi:enoyl-CoA hydratase